MSSFVSESVSKHGAETNEKAKDEGEQGNCQISSIWVAEADSHEGEQCASARGDLEDGGLALQRLLSEGAEGRQVRARVPREVFQNLRPNQEARGQPVFGQGAASEGRDMGSQEQRRQGDRQRAAQPHREGEQPRGHRSQTAEPRIEEEAAAQLDHGDVPGHRG